MQGRPPLTTVCRNLETPSIEPARDGWIGFNLSADETASKIRRIEELLKANGRKRSDVELTVSPYTKPMSPDSLARYRDAGVEEVIPVLMDVPKTEAEMVKRMEQVARDFIEPDALAAGVGVDHDAVADV
jgi:hypothetical protein